MSGFVSKILSVIFIISVPVCLSICVPVGLSNCLSTSACWSVRVSVSHSKPVLKRLKLCAAFCQHRFHVLLHLVKVVYINGLLLA